MRAAGCWRRRGSKTAVGFVSMVESTCLKHVPAPDVHCSVNKRGLQPRVIPLRLSDPAVLESAGTNRYLSVVLHSPNSRTCTTAQGLRGVYEARCRLDFVAVAHAAQLRVDAQLAPGACGIPVTLPYSLLDESLGLSDISFVGPGLLYQARQRVAVGQERRVLVKFVEGRYGDKVRGFSGQSGLTGCRPVAPQNVQDGCPCMVPVQ